MPIKRDTRGVVDFNDINDYLWVVKASSLKLT